LISASTVAIHTGFVPRWIALLGYSLAFVLLVASYHLPWALFVLPIWVFSVNVHILIDEMRRPPHAHEKSPQ
jgi:hypothetical protein